VTPARIRERDEMTALLAYVVISAAVAPLLLLPALLPEISEWRRER
jgi:hypothetical protein